MESTMQDKNCGIYTDMLITPYMTLVQIYLFLVYVNRTLTPKTVSYIQICIAHKLCGPLFPMHWFLAYAISIIILVSSFHGYILFLLSLYVFIFPRSDHHSKMAATFTHLIWPHCNHAFFRSILYRAHSNTFSIRPWAAILSGLQTAQRFLTAVSRLIGITQTIPFPTTSRYPERPADSLALYHCW